MGLFEATTPYVPPVVGPATGYMGTWETTSIDQVLKKPFVVYKNYDCTIYWGDGTSTDVLASDAAVVPISHTYSRPAVYEFEIVGICGRIAYEDDATSAQALRTITQLGDLTWKSFDGMFNGANNLTSFDVGTNARTVGADRIETMFSNCTSLNYVNLGTVFSDPANIFKYGTYMFSNCSSLVNFSSISNIYMEKMDNISGMFRGCSSMVTPPDVSGWNLLLCRYVFRMFEGCLALKNAPDTGAWNIPKLEEIHEMYQDCINCGDFQEYKWQNFPQVSKMLLLYDNTLFDTAEYDRLLIAWEGLSDDRMRKDVASSVPNVKYTKSPSAAFTAREVLTDTAFGALSWSIVDGGPTP